MILKTFHFAGIASMKITEGVPRIEEIINADRTISTPIITAAVIDDRDGTLVRRVKARIEKTTLGEVSEYIKQVFLPGDSFILIKLSFRRICLLQLEVTLNSIIRSIVSARLPIPLRFRSVRRAGRSMIVIRPPEEDKATPFLFALHHLVFALPKVIIKGRGISFVILCRVGVTTSLAIPGLPSVDRCVIHTDEKNGGACKLLVEGTDFRDVLATYEVEPTKTVFNNANTIAEVLFRILSFMTWI